jgi:hypothetical protein
VSVQASQTRIVNKAFALLGTSQRITSLTDASALAATAASLWDEARDETLAAHPWNFAVTRAALAASADWTPPNQYAFAYELPADCLRWLPWAPDHADHFEGEQEAGGPDGKPKRLYLLTNAASPICIRYIWRVEDVALFSEGFKASLSAKLAFLMAEAVTGSSSPAMAELYEATLTGARRTDGLATGQRGRMAYRRSNWLAAREPGGGRG